MKAAIKKVQLKRIDQIWKKHKPQGLGFSDTDVIILEVESEDGKKFNQDFYCRLKADGTLGHSITKASEKRQHEILNFIKKHISKEQNYNVKANFNKWQGKEVEVEKINGSFRIKL